MEALTGNETGTGITFYEEKKLSSISVLVVGEV